ncbi:MAG: tetratricopeptide repeat protein [Armatimonadota bacterium]|nr:tetratricopeptide repeat protein [Armatimonadota bacterium]
MAVEIEQREFDRLVAGIELTDEARYIAIVTCNSPPGRWELIGRLQEALEEKNIGLDVVQLTDPHTGLASTIDGHIQQPGFQSLEERYSSVAIAVNWHDSVIPTDELEDDRRTPSALQKLNLGREYFIEFGHPLILLVPEYVHKRIVRQAPDFYRIRTDTVDFQTALEVAETTAQELMSAAEWQVQSADEARARIDRYAETLERLAGREDGRSRELRARLLNRLGEAEWRLGRHSSAMSSYQHALAIFGDLGDRHGQAEALNGMGDVLRQQGEYREAHELYAESLNISRDLGDRHAEGEILSNMAIAYRRQGHYDRALRLYEASLDIRRETRDRRGEARVLNNMALVHGLQGRHELALDLYEESLSIKREIGDRRAEGGTLMGMASVHERKGRYDEALALYAQSLRILSDLGDRYQQAEALMGMAKVHGAQGHNERALALCGQSLELKREVGDRHGEGRVLIDAGVVAKHMGTDETARAYWQQALSVLEGLGVPEEQRVRELLARLDAEGGGFPDQESAGDDETGEM